MAKEQNTAEIYSEIITSLATTAAAQIEGVTVLGGGDKKRKLQGSDVKVYEIKGKVCIDIFINVSYGYKIPDVVCSVQEKIKKDVEAATRYKIGKINVTVVSINFPKQ